MAREERKKIIERIEKLRGSRVLTYVVSDRQQPTAAQMGDDAVRPLHEQLRAMKPTPKKLDFFLYSRGGAIDVPWRIVSALRGVSDEWNVLIPFRANSAATLIALGADEIVLGPQGELGPIDPQMGIQRLVEGPNRQKVGVQENVSVEDVMAYVRFIQERAGLSDQDALAAAVLKLVDRLDAVTLGSIHRTHSHIRDVARRILLTRKEPPREQVLLTIIETLAEKVYAHGHAIDLKTAKEIGLPVCPPDAMLDEAMWELLEDYEEEMKIRKPVDPTSALGDAEKYEEDTVLAIMESAAMIHRFSGSLTIRAKRQMPQALNVAMNMNLQLSAPPGTPPGAPAAGLPAGLPQALLQQLLAQVQQLVAQQAQDVVQEAVKKQAPIIGIEASFRSGMWKRSD